MASHRLSDLARLTLNVRSAANPSTGNQWDIGPGSYYQSLCAPGRVSGRRRLRSA